MLLLLKTSDIEITKDRVIPSGCTTKKRWKAVVSCRKPRSRSRFFSKSIFKVCNPINKLQKLDFCRINSKPNNNWTFGTQMVDRCRNELYFKAKSRIFRVLVKTRVFLDLEIQVLFQNPDFDRFRSSRNLDPS